MGYSSVGSLGNYLSSLLTIGQYRAARQLVKIGNTSGSARLSEYGNLAEPGSEKTLEHTYQYPVIYRLAQLGVGRIEVGKGYSTLDVARDLNTVRKSTAEELRELAGSEGSIALRAIKVELVEALKGPEYNRNVESHEETYTKRSNLSEGTYFTFLIRSLLKSGAAWYVLSFVSSTLGNAVFSLTVVASFLFAFPKNLTKFTALPMNLWGKEIKDGFIRDWR